MPEPHHTQKPRHLDAVPEQELGGLESCEPQRKERGPTPSLDPKMINHNGLKVQ